MTCYTLITDIREWMNGGEANAAVVHIGDSVELARITVMKTLEPG